jgi:hypothetical protein
MMSTAPRMRLPADSRHKSQKGGAGEEGSQTSKGKANLEKSIHQRLQGWAVEGQRDLAQLGAG